MKRVNATWLKGVVTLAALLVCGLTMHAQEGPGELFERARLLAENARTTERAIGVYEQVAAHPKADRTLKAQATLQIALLHERRGDPQARALFAAIVKEYSDQPEVAGEARARLAATASEVVVRQIWSGPGVNLQGRPSLDGRYLTYVDWSNLSGNLGIRDLVTGENRLLTHATGDAGQYADSPVLSPDNTEVAYTWSETELRIARADGTRQRTLKVDGAPWTIAWSPDGRHLAAVLASGLPNFRIAIVSVNDGTTLTLKSTGWSFPTLGGYSPDGRFLVYSLPHTPPATDGGIFALAVDGSRELPLVQSPNSDHSPVWTPDGRGVVFLSDRSGTQGFWFVQVENATPVDEPMLLRDDVAANHMGFTRDGTFFYGAGNVRRDVYLVDIDPATLEITSAPARLSERFIGASSRARWSPDGQSIAFVRGPVTQSIVIRSLSTGVERVMPTTFTSSGPRFGLEWFPDGSALLFGENDLPNRKAVLRRLDFATGKDTPVLETTYAGLYGLPRISPDGRFLYYSFRTGEDELHLLRRDITTGKETEIYRSISEGVGFFGLSLSPDGTRLAFNFNVPASMRRNGEGPRALMIISADGGSPRELYRGRYSCPAPASGTWTADGRHVLAACDDPQGRRLWAVPTEGGEPRRLNLAMEEIGGFDVSPDGRRLLFTGTQREPEVWSITNLLSRVNSRR